MPREMEWSPTAVPPSVASEGVPVNLLHMELLHHFERFTMPTLCWQEVWPTMLQLAFRVRPLPPSLFGSAHCSRAGVGTHCLGSQTLIETG